MSSTGDTELSVKDKEDSNKEEKPEEEERSQWDNQVQFILTAIGLAVGLGNIWRFPSMAYENGGSAFLIPYVICGMVFGFPMVYAEMTIGQFSRAGPGKAIGRFASGFQGVGWAMSLTSLTVAVYYCVIIAWSGVYLGWIISGNSHKWVECSHSWNTEYCVSQKSVKNCRTNTTDGAPQYFFNGSCVYEPHNLTKQPAEEFFLNWLTPRSAGVDEITSVQWWVFSSLVVMWIITTLTLIKGIEIMGKMSYVTVPLPYVVVVILFFRGVTLDGAMAGIEYYLLKPDFEKLLQLQTWGNALKQLMFSINTGYGGLISLSSYSKPKNNHFRDALIVIGGDTIMSVVGGVAVFSTLGYLANQLGKEIPDVVDSGTSLAFIVYPEAMSTMPAHVIWEFLFFIMIFFLGISSEVALVETFTGCIYDVFPKTKKFKWLVTIITCSLCAILGVIMVTDAGWYWFTLSDSFTGSTVPCICVALECIVLTIYGWKNIKQDLEEMRGKPRFGRFGRFFGPQSIVFAIFWGSICPLLALAAMGITLNRATIPLEEKIAVASGEPIVNYEFPFFAEIIGWTMNLGPGLAIPFMFLYKWGQNNGYGKPFSYLFRPNKDLKSCSRYFKQKKMAHPATFEKKKEEEKEEKKKEEKDISESSFSP